MLHSSSAEFIDLHAWLSILQQPELQQHHCTTKNCFQFSQNNFQFCSSTKLIHQLCYKYENHDFYYYLLHGFFSFFLRTITRFVFFFHFSLFVFIQKCWWMNRNGEKHELSSHQSDWDKVCKLTDFLKLKIVKLWLKAKK